MTSSKIQEVGFFKFLIEEAVPAKTKNGYPQAILRLKAEAKYVDNPADIAFYKEKGVLTGDEPAYVDWTSFDEGITAYLVLFNDVAEFTEKTQNFNRENLQKAIPDWDGTFKGIFGFAGKQILGQVQENSYNEKTTLQIGRVDHVDASPVQALRALDADAIAEMDKKLKVGKPAPKVAVGAPAKPAKAPPKPSALAASTPTPAPAKAAPATSAPPSSPKPTSPSKPPTPAAAAAPKPAVPPATPEYTMEKAWDALCAKKGENTDDALIEAWQAAVAEVANGRPEPDLTPADWGNVVNVVTKDLAL